MRLNPQHTTAAPSILLVDDEVAMTRALARLLHTQGWHTHRAHSADEALNTLKHHRIPVIISDHRMPEVTGAELLTTVKQHYPHTVRLMLSAYADKAALSMAINQGGIYRFIAKPWDDHAILRDIRGALSCYQHSQSLTKQAPTKQAPTDQAQRHPLTDLPNRGYLQQQYRQQQVTTAAFTHILLLIDIDHFKTINHTFGYEMGNHVLVTVATRLQQTVATTGTLVHLNGDQFIVLTGDKPSADYLHYRPLAQQLLAAVQAPIVVNGQRLLPSISIGICQATANQALDGVIRRASIALQQAKQQAHCPYHCFGAHPRMRDCSQTHAITPPT